MLQRYAKLYWQFFKARVKVMMEYRIDFLIGVLGVLFVQGSAVFFVKIVFDHIESLNGYSFHAILFIYGFAQVGRAIEYIFFDNLWVIGMNYIRPGQFDRLLIRPINPLFHLIADRVQADGLGQLLMGIFVLGVAVPHLGIDWGIGNILLLLLLILSSAIIFMAINLFTGTLSFWMVDSLPVMKAVHDLNDFARYPMTIYHAGIRFVLTWIVPFGFTAFYPAALFIDPEGFRNFALLTPVMAAITLTVAYLFWKKGLRAFAGTGS